MSSSFSKHRCTTTTHGVNTIFNGALGNCCRLFCKAKNSSCSDWGGGFLWRTLRARMSQRCSIRQTRVLCRLALSCWKIPPLSAPLTLTKIVRASWWIPGYSMIPPLSAPLTLTKIVRASWWIPGYSMIPPLSAPLTLTKIVRASWWIPGYSMIPPLSAPLTLTKIVRASWWIPGYSMIPPLSAPLTLTKIVVTSIMVNPWL